MFKYLLDCRVGETVRGKRPFHFSVPSFGPIQLVRRHARTFRDSRAFRIRSTPIRAPNAKLYDLYAPSTSRRTTCPNCRLFAESPSRYPIEPRFQIAVNRKMSSVRSVLRARQSVHRQICPVRANAIADANFVRRFRVYNRHRALILSRLADRTCNLIASRKRIRENAAIIRRCVGGGTQHSPIFEYLHFSFTFVFRHTTSTTKYSGWDKHEFNNTVIYVSRVFRACRFNRLTNATNSSYLRSTTDDVSSAIRLAVDFRIRASRRAATSTKRIRLRSGVKRSRIQTALVTPRQPLLSIYER